MGIFTCIYIYIFICEREPSKTIEIYIGQWSIALSAAPFCSFLKTVPLIPMSSSATQMLAAIGKLRCWESRLQASGEKKSHRALHLPKKKRNISQKEKENIPKRKCIHPKSVPFFPTRWRGQPCRRRSSSKSTCLASMGRSSPVSVSVQVWRPGPRFVQKLSGQRFRRICRNFAEGEGYTAWSNTITAITLVWGGEWGPAPWKCRGEKDMVFEMEEKGSPILLNLRSDLLLGKGGLARCGKPETARTIHVALKVAVPNRRSQKSLKREIHLVDKLKPKVYQVYPLDSHSLDTF